MRAPNRVYTDEETETIRKMLRKGHSSKEIARVLNRKLRSVVSKIKSLAEGRFVWTVEKENLLADLLESGKGPSAISKEMGISYGSVVSKIKQVAISYDSKKVEKKMQGVWFEDIKLK